MTHDIRLALADDYPAICAYLEAHWRKGHIFTKSKALFDWQHWNKVKQHYHFVLGCAPDGSIHGVFGFIPNGQWDPALGYESIWLAIWSVCDEAKGHGLGRRLLAFIEDIYKPNFIGTNGATEMTLRMYEERGYVTGTLEQWYCMHGDTKRGRYANPGPSFDEPRKSLDYAFNRYNEHPFYKYRFDDVGDGSAFVVSRRCESPNGDALRVVDFFGAPTALESVNWERMAHEEDVDYIDIFCAGVPALCLERAGFTRRIGNEIIIPNHFEPYENRNIEINYAVKCAQPWRILRGDSDMDRPNVLPC